MQFYRKFFATDAECGERQTAFAGVLGVRLCLIRKKGWTISDGGRRERRGKREEKEEERYQIARVLDVDVREPLRGIK